MEKNYDWLAVVKRDCDEAYCKRCIKTFHIDGSGIPQVKSHAKYPEEGPKQLKLGIKKQTAVLQKKLELTLENQVVKAEILQALNFGENNYSFFNAASDSVRFEMMFSDSQIAKKNIVKVRMISYSSSYDIAPYLKENLMYQGWPTRSSLGPGLQCF